MAVQPVFMPDRASLLARVRLGEDDAPAGVVDQAMEEVRLWLYNANYGLGRTLIASLLTLPTVENPSTEDEITRATANTLEVLLVKRELLQALPTLFMDAGGTHEAWNQEQFTRQADVRSQVDALNAKIMDLLQVLQDEADEAGNVSVAAIEPDETPPSPGDSISWVF